MVIKETGIGGQELLLADLDHIMKDLGFVRWAWDYHHATYDFKIEEKGSAYFLRVPANAVKGYLEDPHCELALDEPFIGKQVFPHGLDYDDPIPNGVLEAAKRKLAAVKDKISHLG